VSPSWRQPRETLSYCCFTVVNSVMVSLGSIQGRCQAAQQRVGSAVLKKSMQSGDCAGSAGGVAARSRRQDGAVVAELQSAGTT
jgi:hypothetical protein